MPDSWVQRSLGRTSLAHRRSRMSVAMPRVSTRGVVFIHSTPKALCPHITWALESVLGQRLSLDWTPQPAGAALVRAELRSEERRVGKEARSEGVHGED